MLAHFGAIAERRAARRHLQHPRPHRREYASRDAARARAAPPQHRRRQRVERRPQADRHDPARPSRASSSFGRATTISFCRALALGADGVVGVASHLCSPEYRAMFDAYRAGRVDEAARIHASLLPLIDALFATTSPIPVKWAMRQLGFRSRRVPLAARRDARRRRRSVAPADRRLTQPSRSVESSVISLQILGCRLDPIDCGRGDRAHSGARARPARARRS